MAGAGPAIRVIGDHQGTASPSSVQPHTWDKERFPTITGIEVVGEHSDSVGIELRKTMKCVISQVQIRRCRIAVHLVERNRDFLLADSHLDDNHENGLFFDRCNLHQIIVQGCHISWNKVAGIKSLGGDVHNLQIVGNDIEYNNATASRDSQILARGDGAWPPLLEKPRAVCLVRERHAACDSLPPNRLASSFPASSPCGGFERATTKFTRLEFMRCLITLIHRLRTNPRTAHALPAPVMGMRFFVPSPPGLVGREVIGQEPSSRCAWIRKV